MGIDYNQTGMKGCFYNQQKVNQIVYNHKDIVYSDKNILRINYSNGVITSAKFDIREGVSREVYVHTIGYPEGYRIGNNSDQRNVEVKQPVYDYKTINTRMTEAQLTQVLKGYQISNRICSIGIGQDTGQSSCVYRGGSVLTAAISTQNLGTRFWFNFKDSLPISIGDYFTWTHIDNGVLNWTWDYYIRIPGFSDYSEHLEGLTSSYHDMYPKNVKCIIRKAQKMTSNSGTLIVELDNINERYEIATYGFRVWKDGTTDTKVDIKKLPPL